MTILVVAWLALTALLAFIAVGSRIGWRRRSILVFILPVVMLLGGALWLELWSGPKPSFYEFRSGEAELVAYHWDEGHSIYLWVLWPGEAMPKSYVLPWMEETARQLEGTEDAVENEGGAGMVEFAPLLNDSVDGSDSEDGMWWLLPSLEDRAIPHIYHSPQPASPMKSAPEQSSTVWFN